jgi:pilus assembly protein CpaB
MRPVTILAVGLVASGTTAALVYRAVQTRVVVKQAPATTAAVAVHPVVVTAGDVPIGSKIAADQLKLVDWPVTALPDGAFDDREKVVGRVALTRMVNNEPVTNDKLAPVTGRGVLPLVIEPGMRAVTVRVNEVAGVGGFIATGSRVDVLVTAEVKTPPQAPDSGAPPEASGARHTRTVLQNVTVLAIGQQLESNGQPKPGEGAALTTATLLVTPGQAELLALGAIEGQLQLVLRNYDDDQIVASPGKSAQDLFQLGTGGRLAVAANRVEMIRGAERFSISF